MKKKLKITEKQIIALLIFNFVIIGLYYSYALFVTKQVQENVAVLSTNGDFYKLTSDDLVENIININSGEKKEIVINVENLLDRDVYYYLLHSKNNTGVSIYETNHDDSTHGLLDSNKEISVTIENNSLNDEKVTFYLQISDEEKMDIDKGYSFINKDINYDHSGANSPVLDDINGIPVYYVKESDTEGVWKKADVTNTNSDAIWYDYDNGMWANMVLVSDDNRDYYKSSDVGEVILEEDILGYFVWIPSFRYKIINYNNLNSYENMIQVNFNNGLNNGTVTCEEDISTLGNKHLYSEKCSDSKYNKIYENLSSYSHPAFNESKGFWVSKFQVSSNSKMIPNAIASTDTILNAFTNIRKMELENNIYGINGNGTNVLESGLIDGDNNHVDTHLLTNMEWGAVAILSNSSYGKIGNSMYKDNKNNSFAKIYANTNKNGYTGCSSPYSNSTRSYIADLTDKCITYNDFTDYTHISNEVNYPIGGIGIGASTTGTVYGVFDMVGGNTEMVAGLIAKENGESQVSWNNNYYDLYSYNDYVGVINSANNAKNLYRYKLGDGIRENYRSFSDNGMWYDGVLSQEYKNGYFIRGGNYNSGKGMSIFTSNVSNLDDLNAYRATISVK